MAGVTAGSLPDYQASALLMAIVLRGMTAEETAYMELIVAGVLELQAGTSPRVMEGMLQSYIKSSDAEKAA